MDKNIAVIGAGYWGKNLVRNFAQLGVLHTICDSDSARLGHFQTIYPEVKLQTDFRSLLADTRIKGIAIAAPAAQHYSLAKQALKAGKDVFVEKPLALRVAEGEELVQMAGERGRTLMVGHLLEYHPAIEKLKELVVTGELGSIQYLYSNRLNLGKFRTEENILWSFAPHDISVILLLLGEMPRNVSAHGGYYLQPEIADVTMTTLSFAKGVRAHILVNWLHPYKEQKLVVVGDKKMAVFDDVAKENKLKLYDYRINWSDGIPSPGDREATPVKFVMTEPLKAECQHFIDCLAGKQPPRTDGPSGLRVLRVLDACQKSLREGGGVISL